MRETTREVLNALQAAGLEVISGKGGFWIKGEGFLTLAQARKRTGIIAPERESRPRQQPWGEFATIALLNGHRFKG